MIFVDYKCSLDTTGDCEGPWYRLLNTDGGSEMTDEQHHSKGVKNMKYRRKTICLESMFHGLESRKNLSSFPDSSTDIYRTMLIYTGAWSGPKMTLEITK